MYGCFRKKFCLHGQVENFGVQIPPEKMDKIFDAFYELVSSRNSKNGGSGLGLYIVKRNLRTA